MPPRAVYAAILRLLMLLDTPRHADAAAMPAAYSITSSACQRATHGALPLAAPILLLLY